MKYLNSFLLSCVAACSCHAELVAHWPLDSDALDATGNGYNGSVVGGTVNFGQGGANGNTGSSAAFPDNGHIDVPFNAALNPSSYTVTLWANASSTGGFASPITSRDDVGGDPGSVHGFILYNDNSGNWNNWTGTGGASGAWDTLSGGAISIDTWTHLAFSYDAGTNTKSFYIDGSLADSKDAGALYSVNGTVESENLHIGSGADSGQAFYFSGNIDDVSIWNEALDQASIQDIKDNGVVSGLSDPALSVPNPIDLVLNGGIQVIEIPINNSGQTQTLTVSAATFNGDPNFSVTTLPGPVTPGSSGNLVVTFDPAGNNGAFEADLKITSNDSLTPVRTTSLRGAIHDPMLVSDATVDLGENTTGTITLTNNGATRSLQVSGITITGDSDNFELTSIPSTIAANGGTDDIEISFDSLGEQGNFSVTLTFNTDDPINPAFIVIVTATVPFSDTLVAWWPLDVDGTDASGNGFDGVVEGSLVASPGANGSTGGSLEFDGFSSRIDVPFDQALNPQDFTVTLWANASTTSGFASPITSRDDVGGGTSTHGYILYNDNGGNWNFWTGDGNPGWDTLAGESVTTGTWTHIAMTFDSVTQTKSIWINGTLAASDVAAAQYSLNGTVEMEPLHIGAGQDNGLNFWFSGKIDDVGLFRVALSPDNINSIMTDGVGGFTGSSRALEITDIALGPNPGEVTITFNSVNGAAYIIERSTNLAPDSWDELTDNHASEGETTSFTDLDVPVGTTKLFYRVIRP